MNSLFQGFINALKARITPLWTKIRLLTSPTYIKGELLRRLIQYFRDLTDVRPKDKDDYYGFFGWLVSKRLAFLIVIVVGMVSAYYVTCVQPISAFTSSGDGVKTYSYRSVPLRFTDGKVRIVAKSKYIAYEGNVSKGTANGMGKLYRKDGSLVYEGQFENNEFHGTGTSYYPAGQVQYVGDFRHNLFSGTGREYRENGSLEYDGAFLEGMKEGQGKLYDSGSNVVFTGNFSKDQLLYSDFLGKSTAEAADIYTGSKTVYTDDDYFVVDMPDIEALYCGNQAEDNLTDTIQIEGIYVLKDSFRFGDRDYTYIAELRQLLGETIYEGNAYLTMPEAVAIHTMNRTKTALHGDVSGTWNQYLQDAVAVEDFDSSYSVYLYSFVQEDIRYTFFCKDRSGKFEMYMMEKANE